MDFDKDSEILKALGHPVRLRMIAGLMGKKECNVNTIVRKLGIPQSTASQHLGVLRSRGIISPKKKGVETCYFVSDLRVRKLLDALE